MFRRSASKPFLAVLLVVPLLTAAVAYGLAAGSAKAQYAATGIVSLGTVNNDIGQYSVTPLAADLASFMTSGTARNAVASGGADGTSLATARADGSSEVTVLVRGSTPAKATAGLRASVQSGLEHLAASALDRSTLAKDGADSRVKSANSDLSSFNSRNTVNDVTAQFEQATRALGDAEGRAANATGPARAQQLALAEQATAERDRLGALLIESNALQGAVSLAVQDQGTAARQLAQAQIYSEAIRSASGLLADVAVEPVATGGVALRSALAGLVGAAAVLLVWLFVPVRGPRRRRRRVIEPAPTTAPLDSPTSTQTPAPIPPERVDTGVLSPVAEEILESPVR